VRTASTPRLRMSTPSLRPALMLLITLSHRLVSSCDLTEAARQDGGAIRLPRPLPVGLGNDVYGMTRATRPRWLMASLMSLAVRGAIVPMWRGGASLEQQRESGSIRIDSLKRLRHQRARCGCGRPFCVTASKTVCGR